MKTTVEKMRTIGSSRKGYEVDGLISAYNTVLNFSNPFNFDLHKVACLKKTRRLAREPDTGWRASCSDVAGVESEAREELSDHLRNTEDELPGA